MAIITQSTNTSSQINVNVTGNIWIINPNVLVAVTSTAMDGTDTNGSKTILVQGTIVADGVSSDGIALGSGANGGSNNIQIFDTGSIFAESNAIQSSGGNLDLVNYGSLSSQTGSTLYIFDDDNLIVNYGQITSYSGSVGATAVHLFSNAGENNNKFINYGFVSSPVRAVAGFEGNDTVINRGEMIGDVALFGGNDVFKGKNGEVDGKIFGGDGNDKLFGSNSDDDVIRGEADNDTIKGRGGDDDLDGGSGKDTITGGRGDDKITGGGGDDVFVFAKNQGSDTITDFQNGKDKIDLSAFGFKNNSKALAKFYELGSGSNDKLAFDYKDTTIIIKGIDMGDLNGADLII